MILLLKTLLIAISANAVVLEGTVCRQNQKMGVRFDGDRQCQFVEFASQDVQIEFSGLQSGDFVRFDATFLDKPNTLRIDSMENVAIRRILGNWYESNGTQWTFENFSKVTKSNPNTEQPDEVFEYELYPKTPESWHLLLSTELQVKVGLLEYRPSTVPKTLRLCLEYTNSTKCWVLRRRR